MEQHHGLSTVRTSGKRAPQIEAMMAEGNLAIYDNIFPVALAYHTGGIDELRRLETTIQNDPQRLPLFRPVRLAFEDIDKGIKLKACGEVAAGERLIREGNNKLIAHEQDNVAQPVVFDKHPDLAFLMSPLAFGDFDADPSKIDQQTASYFWFKPEKTLQPTSGSIGTAILGERAGVGAVTKFEEVERMKPTRFMQSIGDKDARVDWIANEIFPKWYGLTEQEPAKVVEGMRRIIETGRQAGVIQKMVVMISLMLR